MESLRRAAALGRVTSMATAPHEGALLVCGEPGIGKSHLIEAVDAGVDIATTILRINPTERDFAFSGISTILASLHRDGVTELGGRGSVDSDDPDQMFAAAHDLIALIRGLGLPPTLLMIDDIDLADPQSRSLIGILANRLAGTGLRLVMTASTIHADSPLCAMPAISLAPLQVTELIALGESVAADADVSTLRILAWFCGGNPRILVENLRLIDPDQRTGATWLMLPPRFNHALDAIAVPQLASLTPCQLDVLGLASLGPVWHVGAIADTGFETADAIEDLVNEGILRRQGPFVSVKDPRLRSYVYWSTDTHARRERHASLEQAHLVHDAPLSWWHRSFTAYDRTGIDDLLAGAAGLIRAGRLDAAIELSERALRKADRIEDHVSAVIEVCEQLLLAGEVTLAARYSRRVRADAVESVHALRLASFHLVAQMFQNQRIAADDEVRAIVGLHAHTDPDGAGRLLMLAACFRADRWESEEARSLLHDFPHVVDQMEPSAARLVAAVRAAVDALEGVLSDEPVAVDALADHHLYSPVELLTHGYLLTHLERHGDARLLLTMVINHPRFVDNIWMNLARYAMITNEIRAGQFRRARAAIDDWTDDTRLSHRTSLFSYVHAWRSSTLGRIDEANEHLDQCLTLTSLEGSPAVRARALGLRGTLALAVGDPEAAVVTLRQVNGFAGRFRNPSMLRHWADYVEACHLTGRHREAEAVVSALERRLESHQSRWGAIALARSRAIVAPDDLAMQSFTAAIAMIGSDESPYERARALSAMATRQDVLGLPHEARRTRSLTEEAFDAAGILGWPGQRPVPLADEQENLLMLLSQEEIAIARQVQDGMRNREIAESLYLSVRTVELRLTHIYRTLGVRSRSHLVAELARLDAPHQHQHQQQGASDRR